MWEWGNRIMGNKIFFTVNVLYKFWFKIYRAPKLSKGLKVYLEGLITNYGLSLLNLGARAG